MSTVVLWGWADVNIKITIKSSWLEEKTNLKANNEGKWKVEVTTTKSKNLSL